MKDIDSILASLIFQARYSGKNFSWLSMWKGQYGYDGRVGHSKEEVIKSSERFALLVWKIAPKPKEKGLTDRKMIQIEVESIKSSPEMATWLKTQK
jgi:hypothetical protein